MSTRRTVLVDTPQQSPSSRLDHVMGVGIKLHTASINVAGNTPHMRSPVFRVKGGYWATPIVYDVKVALRGKVVAVVGFMEFKQTKGAFFPQVKYNQENKIIFDNQDKILDLARDYARRQTGWKLEE